MGRATETLCVDSEADNTASPQCRVFPGHSAAGTHPPYLFYNRNPETNCGNVPTPRTFNYTHSAAFFEKDVETLVQIGKSYLPEDSPFRRGINDVLIWKDQHDDWRVTRSLVHEHYFESIDGFDVPYPGAGSIVNGLSAIMALLYGEGDYYQHSSYRNVGRV